MAYRSNTLRVRQPPIFIMTPSAIPARRRLRAAVRRRSWKRSPGTPADLQALAHVSRKSFTGFPSGRVSTEESADFPATHWVSRVWMLPVIVTSRPSLFLVVPGSRRIVRAAISIWPALRLMSSLILHPYVRPISTIVWNQRSGQYAISFLYCASSRKPVRILSSVSLGNLGRRKTFGGVANMPIRNIRLSAAISRLIVAFEACSLWRWSTYFATRSLVTSMTRRDPKNGSICSRQRVCTSSVVFRPLIR